MSTPPLDLDEIQRLVTLVCTPLKYHDSLSISEFMEAREQLQEAMPGLLARIAERDALAAQVREVRYILRRFLADPHGCSLCDYGIPRNVTKGHQPDCVYEVARAALTSAAEPQTDG